MCAIVCACECVSLCTVLSPLIVVHIIIVINIFLHAIHWFLMIHFVYISIHIYDRISYFISMTTRVCQSSAMFVQYNDSMRDINQSLEYKSGR